MQQDIRGLPQTVASAEAMGKSERLAIWSMIVCGSSSSRLPPRTWGVT